MRKLTFLTLCLFLAIIVLQTSCNDDTPTPTPTNPCDKGQFTFEMDNVQWTGNSFQNTLVFMTDPVTNVDGRRCDIRATDSNGNRLIITFTNPYETDDNCMETGDYVAVGNLVDDSENVVMFTYNNTIITKGTLNIQSCDPNDNKRMIGTFSFDGMNLNTGDDYIGTNGQFSVCIP